MSEATRSIALSEAVKHSAGTPEEIVAVATMFNAFLESGTAQVVQTHSSPQMPAKAAEAKPKKDVAAKAAAKTEAVLKEEMAARVKATEDAVPATTRQDVALAVEKLLKANKREDAKTLLKKFGAQSVSTVPEDDYEAFVTEANGILAAEDMTA